MITTSVVVVLFAAAAALPILWRGCCIGRLVRLLMRTHLLFFLYLFNEVYGLYISTILSQKKRKPLVKTTNTCVRSKKNAV